MTPRIFYQFSIILFLSLIGYSYFYNPAPQKDVVILSSTEPQEVVKTLKENGYLNNYFSYWTFKIVAYLNPEKFQKGGYALSKNFNIANIYETLKNEPDYKYIRIEEGLRKEQIANVLASNLNWSEEKKNQFSTKNPLCAVSGREGYLFPGDYLVSNDSSIQDIQTEMENNFENNFEEIRKIFGEDYVLNDEQIVTVASLIQREAAGKSDMRLISGIIWNRIIKGMPLQIDATLQYVKGDSENWWPVPKSEDKFIDSPYNTYQNKGLPPAPIANPGKEALKASLNPAQTKCLFYLHDKWGNIHCSSTYDGHLANIKRYL